MEDCIFCKIASGAIPSEKTEYENGTVMSVLDIHPVTPGHTLIIPHAHYRWFWELPDDLANSTFKVAREVAAKLKEEQSCDFVQLSIVGKDVAHVHLHLIPRMLHETKLLA